MSGHFTFKYTPDYPPTFSPNRRPPYIYRSVTNYPIQMQSRATICSPAKGHFNGVSLVGR